MAEPGGITTEQKQAFEDAFKVVPPGDELFELTHPDGRAITLMPPSESPIILKFTATIDLELVDHKGAPVSCFAHYTLGMISRLVAKEVEPANGRGVFIQRFNENLPLDEPSAVTPLDIKFAERFMRDPFTGALFLAGIQRSYFNEVEATVSGANEPSFDDFQGAITAIHEAIEYRRQQ